MPGVAPTNFGISFAQSPAGNPPLFTLNHKDAEPSGKVYEDISHLIETTLEAGKSSEPPAANPLEKHSVKRVHINEKEISFIIENGKAVKYQVPAGSELTTPLSKIFNGSIKNITLALHPIDNVIAEVVKSSNFKKVLYLYSSGGAGHVSAKNALRDKALFALQENIKKALGDSQGKEMGNQIFRHYFPNDAAFADYCKAKRLYEEKDVLADFVGKLGQMGANSWDEAQKAGDVEKQERLAGMQWLTKIFFAPPVFIFTLLTLIYYKPERVVCTQAVCNDAILSAISVYNSIFRPQKTS